MTELYANGCFTSLKFVFLEIDLTNRVIPAVRM